MLKGYAYLCIEGSFDPDDITKRAGVAPSDEWRKGSPRRFGTKTHPCDFWEIDSPAGRTSSLTAQADALNALLESHTGLGAALKPHDPVLQYGIETGKAPVEFRLSSPFIRNLVTIRAEVDCDLYFICRPECTNGTCTSCRIAVPSKLSEIQSFIGGQRNAAECQFHFLLFDVAKADAVARFDLDLQDTTTRLGDHDMDVRYIDGLNCLQFSSDLQPCSGYIASLDPLRLLSRFLKSIHDLAKSISLASNHPAIRIRYIERRDFQSTAGLGFTRKHLRDISALHASVTTNLTYIPDPSFDSFGTCVHCQENVLRAQATL